MNKTLLLCALLLLGIGSCEKWNLDTEDFLQVSITAVDSLSIDSVRVTGQITGLVSGRVQDHGLVWNTGEEVPTILFNAGARSLGLLANQPEVFSFNAPLALEPATDYVLRAYATVDGNEYIYSTDWPLTTGGPNVFTGEVINPEETFRLEISGRLTGTDKGFTAAKHGFCWSLDSMQPDLEDNRIDLGIRRDNETFSAAYDDPPSGIPTSGKPMYFRAYAIFFQSSTGSVDTIYGEMRSFDGDLTNTRERIITDEPAPKVGAFGFAIGDRGYVGTGTAENNFWEFDPTERTWQAKADFIALPDPVFLGNSVVVAFSTNSMGYVYVTGTDNNFWGFDPENNTWSPKNDFPGEYRENAVGFVIDDRVFLGSGSFLNLAPLDDFWIYDPLTDTWDSIAPIPKAISYATSFTIGSTGYVTMGDASTFPVNNLWAYDPQSDQWTAKTPFPGKLRRGALSFTLNNKGFISFGDVAETDLWMYDPETDTWLKRKEDYRDRFYEEVINFRLFGVGFSINGKGYFGFGPFYSDFHVYDP